MLVPLLHERMEPFHQGRLVREVGDGRALALQDAERSTSRLTRGIMRDSAVRVSRGPRNASFEQFPISYPFSKNFNPPCGDAGTGPACASRSPPPAADIPSSRHSDHLGQGRPELECGRHDSGRSGRGGRWPQGLAPGPPPTGPPVMGPGCSDPCPSSEGPDNCAGGPNRTFAIHVSAAREPRGAG
jgi:hypothetical protein